MISLLIPFWPYITGGIALFSIFTWYRLKLRNARIEGEQQERKDRDRIAMQKKAEADKITRKPVTKSKTVSKLRKGGF